MHLNSLIVAQGHHFAGEGEAIMWGIFFIWLLGFISALVLVAIVWGITKAIRKWRSKDLEQASISCQFGDGSARNHNERHRRRNLHHLILHID